MEIALALLAAALTTYRLSLAVARERGPFSAFLWLRNRFLGENWVAEGIRCAHCVSFWLGLLLGLYLAIFGYYPWHLAPLVGLAFSGLTIILDKYWRTP